MASSGESLMQRKRMLGVMLSAALLPCASLLAQSAVDGAIGGTVQDAQSAAVAGASVRVHNNGTNAELPL